MVRLITDQFHPLPQRPRIQSMSDKTRPTSGQVERTLSQRIQSLYREQLGHQPGKVSVTIAGERITILIEQAITQPEQLLADLGREELTEQIRSDLDQAIAVRLRELIEEVVGIKVIDLLSDTTLETGRTGSIAVLASVPQFRTPTSKAVTKSKSSSKKKTSANGS